MVSEIRSRLTSFLRGETSLHDFQVWFVPGTWGIDEGDEDEDLVSSIELALAEYTSGHRTEDDLREMFRGMVGQAIVTVEARPYRTSSAATVSELVYDS